MRASLLAALAVLGATAAHAEDPCVEDVKNLCGGVQPGGGRVEQCLRQNKAAVSPACSVRLDAKEAKARSLVEEFSAACQIDVGRLCSEVKPGEGRLLACLVRHQDDLSSSCQAETVRFQAAREKVLAVRSACRADVERVCKGVPPEAGPLVECLQEHVGGLSPECRSIDPALYATAAELVDALDALSSKERIMETLEILQGIDSVAFTRSQIGFQADSIQALAGQANALRFTFSPQFVFGHRNEFALVAKIPVLALYPYTPQIASQAGLSDITTGFGWAFHARGQIRQYLGLGLQWKTAAQPLLGGPWALEPTYAIAIGLARWLSVTAEVTWARSFGPLGNYPEINVLYFRPILVAGLPASSFVALDTRLGWDLAKGTFIPIMKAVAGKFIDRGKSLSVSGWYQASLTSAAVSQSFKFDVGVGLSYFFDW